MINNIFIIPKNSLIRYLAWHEKIYRIKLTPEERAEPNALTTSGKRTSANKVIKARALLLAHGSAASNRVTRIPSE